MTPILPGTRHQPEVCQFFRELRRTWRLQPNDVVYAGCPFGKPVITFESDNLDDAVTAIATMALIRRNRA